MKKIFFYCIITVMAAMVSSCGGYISSSKISSVQQGMTTKEITKIFGNPDYRRFSDNTEEWEYRKAVGGPLSLPANNIIIIVTFTDGRVSSFGTYEDRKLPPIPDSGHPRH